MLLVQIYWYIGSMGRVSKKIINKNLKKEVEEQLSFMISSMIDKGEINLFLDEFLTKEEKVMLGKRLILYMMLYKGLTSVQIQNTLSMSFETIRWYRHIFENKPMAFKKRIKKLIEREHNKQLWEKIEKLLEPVGLALQAKTNMRARAKLAQGDFWQD